MKESSKWLPGIDITWVVERNRQKWWSGVGLISIDSEELCIANELAFSFG